ncbi:helix-turn-helix domain-containing protein [Paenibacillus aquistagni]|uniref:Helix-turn-helix n=1 Tax=Paenibacillus aquistagni TaxID=1852522 RepID=A0A1X7LTB7_9BACL|nr:helix-turn-helix transcriptional regulator [Paenibacillus aquistagni]SMG56512.1 Helix-turn-helix [Paenibacillus aquistagni]
MKKENEFGEYLKLIRKQEKLTLTELAKKTGLSHSYLSQLENGKRKVPPINTLLKISRALDVSIAEMPFTSELSNAELETFYNELQIETLLLLLKIIGKDDHHFKQTTYFHPKFNKLIDEFKDIFKVKKNYISPRDILDTVCGYDGDLEIIQNWIEELNEVAEWHNEVVDPLLFSGDLSKVLQSNSLTFNNRKLSRGDRQRILDMLHIMFPYEDNRPEDN